MSFEEIVEQWLQGNLEATEQLGKKLYSSENISYMLRRVADIHEDDPLYSQALVIRGSIYEHGEGGEGGSVNYPEAIRLFEQAIALGNTEAMAYRAYMHHTGKGGSVNYPEAIGLYEQAIALGYSWAMVGRAVMHLDSESGSVNFPEAIRLLKQAIALGNSSAMSLRAYMHLDSDGGSVNYPEAIGLLEQAIALGDSDAMYQRAVMHLNGEGGSVNYPEAIRLLEKAIALGNTEAMVYRAVMHRDGKGGSVNYPEAIRLYEQAIALGDSDAMYQRAVMHYRGRGGSVNYPEAIQLYEQAIALGNSSAMSQRAYMHKHGEGGSVNYPEAIRLYEQAIALGNSYAMNDFACMHEEGAGGPVDYPEAIRLYEQAIALGNRTAMARRAVMHYQGQGGPVNYPEAIRLTEQAIALGDSGAMYNRAWMHEHGQGGDVNLKVAIQLYYQAFLHGTPQSIEALVRLSQHTNTDIKFESEKSLILINLQQKETSKAFALYQANKQYLAPLLCEDLMLLIDGLPKKEEQVEQLLDFLQTDEEHLDDVEQWPYIQFKILLYHGQDEEALAFYSNQLQTSSALQAHEFYRLGTACLKRESTQDPDLRIKQIEQACLLFYQGYQKGDKDCYALLIHLLRDKDAIEKGQTVKIISPDQVRDENDETNLALLQRFEEMKDAKVDFLSRHKQLFKASQSGFFGGFRKTKLDSSWNIKEIIEHGMAHNNRTRQVCVEKGWLSKTGQITESTPAFIKQKFTLTAEASEPRP